MTPTASRPRRRSEPALERERLEELFDAFRGLILQTPPPVSAKKVAGRPAYELARKNIAVELTAGGNRRARSWSCCGCRDPRWA